jgi:sugar (pentulose or hexulose) kinase
VLADTGLTGPVPVIAVGSHDTASAVVGVPAEGERFAFISCGTWSLVGVELPAPVLTEASRAANFSNELGVDGTVRYLRNVMGLWLLQECLRAWPDADLLTVLDEEPAEAWPGVLRDELVRWADDEPGRRRARAGAWIDGQLTRASTAPQLAEAWLGALLELPPEAMERVLRDALSALARHDADARERFRAGVASASARFHTPQLVRLRDALERLSGELGLHERWS